MILSGQARILVGALNLDFTCSRVCLVVGSSLVKLISGYYAPRKKGRQLQRHKNLESTIKQIQQ